eukprot:jgi/Chrzof1/13901/Cz08g16190.t1
MEETTLASPTPAPPKRAMGFWWCCGPTTRERKPKRDRKQTHRRRRDKAPHTLLKPVTDRKLPLEGPVLSVAESDFWHDARDAFSVSEGEARDHSPMHSSQASPRHSFNVEQHPGALLLEHQRHDGEEAANGEQSSSGFSDDLDSSDGVGTRFVGCLSMFNASPSMTDHEHGDQKLPHNNYSLQRSLSRIRPHAGVTLPRRSPSESTDECRWCWDECDASTYSIRSSDYMRTKQKVSSAKAFYKLVAADLFATDTKAFHIAKHMQLPAHSDPVLVRSGGGSPADTVLPPLMIFNIQLPNYPAAFFGSNDGPGQSIVFYFALPDDFDPLLAENQAAVGLLQRFVANGREADGTPTRERLKLIARVCNPEEWAKKGPLSSYEYKLLINYNEKPVLTRPQHYFHVGPEYLEVDLDIHSYAYLARKALNSYHSRLKDVIWEVCFVIQGNRPEELPEQVLGCGRLYRTDFEKVRPLTEYIAAAAAAGGGEQSQPSSPVALSSREGTPQHHHHQQQQMPAAAVAATATAAAITTGRTAAPVADVTSQPASSTAGVGITPTQEPGTSGMQQNGSNTVPAVAAKHGTFAGANGVAAAVRDPAATRQ